MKEHDQVSPSPGDVGVTLSDGRWRTMSQSQGCCSVEGARKARIFGHIFKTLFFYQMSPNLLMLPEMLWISLHWQLSRSDMALSIFGFKLSLLLFGGLRQKIIKVAL